MMTKNPAFSDDLPFQPRILAIQSAVLVGAVGNDAAIPVYTHFRQKAARLDTVRLAAHPGFQAGFSDIEVVDVGVTSLEEQRRTPWMTFHSLEEFLDPEDPARTIEGFPAPRRAILTANLI